MAKKVKFESFVYQLLTALKALSDQGRVVSGTSWGAFTQSLQFSYEKGAVRIVWSYPWAGEKKLTLEQLEFYSRGDTEQAREAQKERGLLWQEDAVRNRNRAVLEEVASEIAAEVGMLIAPQPEKEQRLETEARFHDDWAYGADVSKIDVLRMNEVCTAPEMRFIRKRLGNMRGKRLLDVGCGLGEASVYFAMQGASVKAMDLSAGMLDATRRLAARYGVQLETHQSAAEQLLLPEGERFDIIYAGNLLHHVDIERTLRLLRPYLAHDGLLVTWDPLAYNPVINVYRRIATNVRTPDEHPLRWADIRLFRTIFPRVETRYFWLTTLVIFLVMAIFQRRNPNKERFWKVVVDEGEKWQWLYRPLELLDRALLAVFPPLRLLCWNVVIVAHAGTDRR